ncbi:glycosyltransferase family 4 protein [Lacibacter sp. MH-610]|uniref:glycosyltransferase family 4 protein n=1 Tax=Lacibacter sp. MH-610 TaxID=3020883 RepID=UPI0038921516
MKTKLLIFYDHFYPSYKAGGPTQSVVNLVRALHQEFELSVVCKPHEMGASETLPGIRINQWMDWEQKARVFYWKYGWRQILQLKRVIMDAAPGIIYINGIYSLFFNFLPLLVARSVGAAIVVAPRGMLHDGALSQKTWKKIPFLFLFQLLGLPKKIHWHATDETEANFIRSKMGNDVRISIAPNLPNLLSILPAPEKKKGELILGSIALISPMKNHLEVIKALQHVQAKVEWHIYGPVKDAAYWKQCKAMTQQLPANVQMHYHGELPPQELSNAMQQFQVFILPSKSENFGHALAEALSAGKPIITSVNTPFAGIESYGCGKAVTEQEMHLQLAEAIEQYASMDATEFNQQVTATQSYTELKFKNTDVLKRYYSLFSDSFAS